MFKLQELGKLIETKLNFEGNNYTPAYSFIVHTEIGENTNNSYINCVLRVDKPKVSTVPGIKNNQYNFVLDMVIPANGANYDLSSIETIIDKFVENYNGKEYSFNEGKAILSFSLTGTGNFKTEYGQGNIVPLSMNIFVNYSENVVLNKVYLLNNKILPYSFEELLLEKDGKTTPIYGEKYQQSFLTLQRKYYHFRLPNDDLIASDLLSDMLQGDMNKQYTLKFYDGNIFTEENPYETTVSIVRMGNSKHERPNTPELDLTFADVDSGAGLTKYELALIDNPFDAQSENTRYFESQEVQQAYYENLIENGGANWDRIKAPNLNSIDLTNQIYKNTTGYDVFDLANKNYAIIKVTQYIEVTENDIETTTQEKINYFYYFVQNSSIGLFNQVAYDLQLDSVQTYYFNPNIEFKGNFINKAHLDRWIDNGDGTISFNGVADSDLFEREEIKQVAKRLVSREKLKYKVAGTNANIADWFNKKVLCWAYILVGTVPVTIKNITDNSNISNYNLQSTFANYGVSSIIDYGFKVLCYPIYKYDLNNLESGRIKIHDIGNSAYIEISDEGFKNFINNNNGFTDIYSIKLSIKPPMHYLSTTYTEYTITSGDLIIRGQKRTSGQIALLQGNGQIVLATDSIDRVIATGKNDSQYYGLFEIEEDNTDAIYLTCDITLPQLTFNKTTLNTAQKNKTYNPKINSVDYKELVLTFAGSQFVIDLQKLNSSTLDFKYNEMITADTTKGLLRLNIANTQANTQKIFNPSYASSFNGFSFTNDLTIPFSTNAYDTFIANNKNAYLSFQNQQVYTTEMYKMNSLSRVANVLKNPLSIFGEATNYSVDTLKTGIQLAYNQAQFELNIDNMKNAPDSLSNANGNALFICAVAEFGIYAEIYEGINIELEMANDIMYRDGFTYNRFGNIKDFDNIRKYFNYVKAIIGNIGGIAISNNARNDLRQRFLNGIRFWNSDNIDYSKENIEKSIEI